ncbi:hypothetical protein [Burkholderia lata]|uniref:hypothetical protein n=1 Tax=Burkholderia lata (strain ATCC 17760 / DSM 23089 / LMG 22485 / NCIMB 9086 / R18194 / 383) TaxID=482957 RepID=UPI00158402DD|nr:hypothetical protein [Burkholderia lata]
MEILLFKPKALKSRFGVGGSTRSLLAASEQDFGVPKQNLRGTLRFGPIFYPSLSFRTGSGVTPDGWGQNAPDHAVVRLCIHDRQKGGFVCDSLL